LASCVSEMQNVVGETIPESELRFAALKYDYNFDLALNAVLQTECSTKTAPKAKTMFDSCQPSRSNALFAPNIVNKNKGELIH
jgi:hypothetical protein